MKYLIITITALFISFSCIGQQAEFARLDSLFSLLEDHDRFFGSVAVTRDGAIVYQKAIGYADLDGSIPNNTATKFRIGSISKTFTATLLMKAVELGKVSLDDNIEGYFPDISNASTINLRQLLNHRSGIANFTDRNYESWHTDPITQEALLDTIIARGVDFAPGTDYAYSNSNYVLLTWVLEHVFDKKYDDLLEQYIVRPLSLVNTAYGGEINTSHNEAKSYHMGSEWVENSQDHMSIPLGAGGVVSTPTDLCAFIQGLFSGKIISSESLAQMKPVGDDQYGFGMYKTGFKSKNGLGHGGNIDAFTSNVVYFPESDISVAISCNGSNYSIHDVEVSVWNEMFDQPYELPSFEFVELSTEQLDKYTGTYVTKELPMDFVVTREGNTLFLQATGQSRSAMSAEGEHKFSIMKYGVKMTFNPAEDKLHFEQNGYEFDLEKKTEESSAILNEKSTSVAPENLDQYTGTYRTDDLPIDLMITKNENTLYLEVTGQTPGELAATGDHRFSIEEYGVQLEFTPSENRMTFKQGGMAFELDRVGK